MVYLFFGLPGCGKTTLMVQRIIKYHKRFPKRNIYCNVGLNLDYVTFIKNSDIGLFNLHDGIIFIDEASLFADSREYKNFSLIRSSTSISHLLAVYFLRSITVFLMVL